MADPGALAVTFELGRDFYVAEIQDLLRQALTRALCATGQGLGNLRPSRRCRQGPPAVNERLVQATGLCGRQRKKSSASGLNGSQAQDARRRSFMFWCGSKHFCRDFDSVGGAFLLRLRLENLRWSLCS